MSNAEETLKTWLRRVWKEEDATAIDEMLVPDIKADGLGEQSIVGPEALKQFHCAMCSLLSDFNFTIDKCLEEDGWISALCTLNAKSRKTGEAVSITGNMWVKTRDGKLIEGYNHFDFIGLLAQLGLLPNDTFEQGLKGCKVK
ncbi:ester cyclase [Kiloniella sp.]|uniref:ester cyclase n=1 Tax=Kiloniella sp. TaxID=1938587 RepID=UPI003B0220E9